ncbi:MAG: hypothetical protein D6766_08885 [Verrucomicrobia bacterium]|nr:MAG: hypothetical protein D6766_08885 [Verrucomicrobiota bacterium]
MNVFYAHVLSRELFRRLVKLDGSELAILEDHFGTKMMTSSLFVSGDQTHPGHNAPFQTAWEENALGKRWRRPSRFAAKVEK